MRPCRLLEIYISTVIAITVLQYVVPWGSLEHASYLVAASNADGAAHARKGPDETAEDPALVQSEESCLHALVLNTLDFLKILHHGLQRFTTRRTVGAYQALVDFKERARCFPQSVVASLCTALTTQCADEKPDDDTWQRDITQDSVADACSGKLGSPAPLLELERETFRLDLLRALRIEKHPGSAISARLPMSDGTQPTQGAPHLTPGSAGPPPEPSATSCLCPGPLASVTSSDLLMLATSAREQLCVPAGAPASPFAFSNTSPAYTSPASSNTSHAAESRQLGVTPSAATQLLLAHAQAAGTRQDAAQVGGAADGGHVDTAASGLMPHAPSHSYSQPSPRDSLTTDSPGSQPIKGTGTTARPAANDGESRPLGSAPRDPGLSPPERAHVKEIARWLMGSPFARELVGDAMRLMKGIPLTGSGEPLASGSQPYCPLNNPPGCHKGGLPLAFYQLYHDCCNLHQGANHNWAYMMRNARTTWLRLGGRVRPRTIQTGRCQDVNLEQLTRAIRPGGVRQVQLGEYSVLPLLGFAAAAPPCLQATWGRWGAKRTWLGTSSASMLKKRRPLPCGGMKSMPWQDVDLQHDAIYWGSEKKGWTPYDDPRRDWSMLGYEREFGGVAMTNHSLGFYQRVFRVTEHPSQHVQVDARSPFAAPLPTCSYFILSVPSFLNYSKFLIILAAYIERMYPNAFVDDESHPFSCFFTVRYFSSRCISYFMETMTMTYMGNVRKLVYVSQGCEVTRFPDLSIPTINSNGLFRHLGINAIFYEMLKYASRVSHHRLQWCSVPALTGEASLPIKQACFGAAILRLWLS